MNKLHNQVIAVFDIGKTNKKFILFSRNYKIVYECQKTFDRIKDDDGDSCEDLSGLTDWMQGELKKIIEASDFRIQDLNFSTYGASLVHLDENGKRVCPLYDYMKSYPEEILESFYSQYGGKKRFSVEAASPPMGMLNSGLQLYWLKVKKPDIFEKIRYSLHLPQYLSYLFTGKLFSELTSIGCHTAMWNFNKMKYHRWLDQEKFQNLLPETVSVSKSQKILYKGTEFNVGVGIHDSSAALVPYLKAMENTFLLLSSGTWSITFNPFNDKPLTYEELQQDCLCYLNVYGKQVKASRVFLGNEYRYQKDKLVRHFQVAEEDEEVVLDEGILNNLIHNPGPDKRLKLETSANSGPYPSIKPEKWNVSVFSSYKEAYHQLVLDLVLIQEKCIHLAEGGDNIENVIITGGFSYNNLFLNLLATRLSEKKIFTSTIPHATALGTAMVFQLNNSNNLKSMKKFLKLKRQLKVENSNIKEYYWILNT